MGGSAPELVAAPLLSMTTVGLAVAGEKHLIESALLFRLPRQPIALSTSEASLLPVTHSSEVLSISDVTFSETAPQDISDGACDVWNNL